MKKRLRKKKHLGEFTVMTVPVQFWIDGNWEEVIDPFIYTLHEFADDCGIRIGFGVGSNGMFRTYIERETRHGSVEEHAAVVADLPHPAIRRSMVGRPFNAWHGTDDLDDGLPPLFSPPPSELS